MKLTKLAHTKNAEVLLTPAMCVAIADADAHANGTKIPDDSPAYHGGTKKALIRRNIFEQSLTLIDRSGKKHVPKLTEYGRCCVDVALYHYITGRSARSKKRGAR
jgi:hypothetical protein